MAFLSLGSEARHIKFTVSTINCRLRNAFLPAKMTGLRARFLQNRCLIRTLYCRLKDNFILRRRRMLISRIFHIRLNLPVLQRIRISLIWGKNILLFVFLRCSLIIVQPWLIPILCNLLLISRIRSRWWLILRKLVRSLLRSRLIVCISMRILVSKLLIGIWRLILGIELLLSVLNRNWTRVVI